MLAMHWYNTAKQLNNNSQRNNPHKLAMPSFTPLSWLRALYTHRLTIPSFTPLLWLRAYIGHTLHQQNKHSPDTIKQWVGHENPEPTRRYAEVTDEDETTESVVIPLDVILSSDSSEDENTYNDDSGADPTE